MLKIMIEKENVKQIEKAIDVIVNVSFEKENEDACIIDESCEVHLLIINGVLVYMSTHLELVLLNLVVNKIATDSIEYIMYSVLCK